MRILSDMNLTPAWCEALQRHGHEAVHWSAIGPPNATDETVLDWAKKSGFVVLTHDLDFGAILAVTQASGPSVVQVRAQDVMPAAMAQIVVNILRDCEGDLAAGALVVVDEARARMRILPLTR